MKKIFYYFIIIIVYSSVLNAQTNIDWCNLQFPESGTINQGQEFIVYAQIYVAGVTDQTGQGTGISCWIGYSTTNTNPNNWTNWISATYNGDAGNNNNDEYKADLGSSLLKGNYYYASRFSINSGSYYYGGYPSGFWDGTNNISGTLTVGDPMPVELTSFSASVIGKSVKLNWKTATEVNNYGFEILRQAHTSTSLNVTDWEKIGFVNGNGNSNLPKSYSFTDRNVNSGKYSYRLKQIDNDGTFEHSKIVEADLGAPTKFELIQNYPNPFNPTTTISYDLPEAANVKLTIFNILGQEIATLVDGFKEAGNYSVNFDADNLDSGLYIYKLQAGSQVQTKKMTLIK